MSEPTGSSRHEPEPTQEPHGNDGAHPRENPANPRLPPEDRRSFLRKLETLAFLTLGITKLAPPSAAAPSQPPVDDGCGDPLPDGSGHYEDLYCVLGGSDGDCGKKAYIGLGAGWKDNDCEPPGTGSNTDEDCGKKSPTTATHTDNNCGETIAYTSDKDCGRLAAHGGACQDNNCFLSDDDCGMQGTGQTGSAHEDGSCSGTAVGADNDCGTSSYTPSTGHSDSLCGSGSSPTDSDCGILAASGTHADSDCASSANDNACTAPPGDADAPLPPNPPNPPQWVL